MFFQHGIGLEKAGRFNIDNEMGVLAESRDVAGEHDADFVGEDRFARIVDHTAAIAITIEHKSDVGFVLEHRFARGIEHAKVFRIRIVGGEGIV